MNTARFVDEQITIMKNRGAPLSDIAWEAALACVGWPYVYGAWGAYCTVAERKKRYSDDHPTIKTKCQAYTGGTCDGCQWFPDGQRVRCFDCRGFTDWILKQAGIIDLVGEGATGQWNTASNWAAKGTVKEGIPQGVIVCLFYPKKDDPKKMAHTGLYFNGETVECSSGVEHHTKMAAKWTHWAVPNGLDGSVPVPTPAPLPDPEPIPGRPTLRRGSKGDAVAQLQTMLRNRGYDLGPCGVDGDFGRATEAAVKLFQEEHMLNADGIVGKLTWDALDKREEALLYTVHIPFLPYYKAEALVKSYSGASMTQEGRNDQ